jgi:hypothetical protein
MIRRSMQILAVVGVIGAVSHAGSSRSNPQLQTFLRQNIGLSQDQIAAIRNGEPFAKAFQSRTPDEVFLIGTVYIHAGPDAYLRFARDFDRLRKLPNYLALGVFSDPPQSSDLKDFSLDDDDIKSLKDCKPGHCLIQLPAGYIEQLQRSVDWSAPDVKERVNQLVRKGALQLVLDYQREGNLALGVYNDKRNPTLVPQQFAYMLSYQEIFPRPLPGFYRYLLNYPSDKPANVEDTFYWARVKFGLKPTLRIVHVATMKGKPSDDTAYAIAEKQLYSSHYFETALDLSFCIPGRDDSTRPGFYLIMIMGSEQEGLTGFKGSIVRNTAVGRSVSNLQRALTHIRDALEGGQ